MGRQASRVMVVENLTMSSTNNLCGATKALLELSMS
jgi:hypothetical protein